MRAKTILLACSASQRAGKSHADGGSQHSSQAVTQCESEASLNSVTVNTMGAGMMLMISVVTVSHFMFN